eukprot:30711-Pelagococcus_subviridis.AAC.2
MSRRKSLRIGVHLADGVVWEPVYRTRLRAASSRRISSRCSRARERCRRCPRRRTPARVGGSGRDDA